MKNSKNKKKYFSQTWGVEVRPEIAKEFTYDKKIFDENLAGLHEIRARLADKFLSRYNQSAVQSA